MFNKHGRLATITGLGIGLPDTVLTNHDLEKMIDTSDEWIRERTGIRERRIAGPQQATSDMAAVAAKMAMEQAGVEPGEIDMIILCTVTPDRFVPMGASNLQEKINATRAAAFDLNAACSGFLYGMAVAQGLIFSGRYQKILLVGGETLSRIINYQDRNTGILFGDGAGAAVVVPSDDEHGLLAYDLGCDGSGGDLLQVPAGGSRIPATRESVEQGLHFVQMRGNEIFKLAVRAMVRSVDQSLADAGLTREDIDWVVPHQANQRIIEAASSRLGVGRDKVIINIDRYGNTAAASIPIALYETAQRGLLKEGDIVALTGFGAGLTWGSAIIRWGRLGE
ncbi:MAG: ketoacyl-ACP synthase III [Firmicutes bacterium]|nr:ketoacyl-ACP synthase III [Bacillota bacterium]